MAKSPPPTISKIITAYPDGSIMELDLPLGWELQGELGWIDNLGNFIPEFGVDPAIAKMYSWQPVERRTLITYTTRKETH